MRADLSKPDVSAVKSLLAFWSSAGVDTCYEDQPVDRTARLTMPSTQGRATQGRATQGRAAQARGAASHGLTHPGATSPREKPGRDSVDDARQAATAAGDLEALAAAIAAFNGCPLRTAGARQSVFARGAPNGPVLLIGEAPGADEDQQGAPFVGRAGRLLDRMLEAAGLSEKVFITNTVFWRPPGNRTPTVAEQQACAPFLERAIELVAPKVLLLVGGASAKAMMGAGEGILSLRGRWLEWRSRDGAITLPALPTLHPAFLLRQPGAKKLAWADMLTLTQRLAQLDSAPYTGPLK